MAWLIEAASHRPSILKQARTVSVYECRVASCVGLCPSEVAHRDSTDRLRGSIAYDSEVEILGPSDASPYDVGILFLKQLARSDQLGLTETVPTALVGFATAKNLGQFCGCKLVELLYSLLGWRRWV